MTDPAHFLIVGDATDIPLIKRMLERLPVDAYGQVFIEVATSAQLLALDAPVDMSVTWLVRADRTSFLPRGEAAASAVLCWIAEWLPEDATAHSAPYVMWIGCATSRVMDRLYEQLGDRLDDLHLHHTGHD